MSTGNGSQGAVVVLGAGQAGVTVAGSLRESGWTGPIRLVGGELGAPYQRPALSKGYLAGTEDDGDLILRTTDALEHQAITYFAGRSAVAIDRESKTVLLDSAEILHYDKLVFATGSKPRTLPIPGADLSGVQTLRTREDSARLKSRLVTGNRLIVAGGGFLGLEAAATAAQAGLQVVVLERSDQLLQRAIGSTVSQHLAALHRAHGVQLIFRAAVQEFLGTGGKVDAVALTGGSTIPADAVLVAVGAAPLTEVAERAGLEVADGIVVDERLRTADQDVFAIGDCARYPSAHADAVVRLESVQNAVDGARHVAAILTDRTDARYSSVPWFWSHQYDRNLQIAGLSLPSDGEVLLSPSKDSSIAVARVRDGEIVAVETINDPKLHLKARRLLAHGPVEVARITEVAVPLTVAAT